jgi:hypothetical protein
MEQLKLFPEPPEGWRCPTTTIEIRTMNGEIILSHSQAPDRWLIEVVTHHPYEGPALERAYTVLNQDQMGMLAKAVKSLGELAWE